MRWSRVLAAPAILLVCVLFYWKLSLSGEYVWFDHPDMCYIELPRLQFQAREMHAGRFPLWTTGIWMGQPLLGQTQPGPVFPLNIALLLLPLRDGYLDFRFLNWYYVLAHAIAAAGMYALCRDLRRSRMASSIAAFAFAFGGFIGTVAWLDVLNGAIWTPLICLFFLRAVRGRRPWTSAVLGGLTLGVAWLSGHHEIPLLVSYALVFAWLYAAWRRGPAVLAPAAVTFLIAGLTAAVQLLPTAEFARLSRRWVGLAQSYGWKESIPYISPTGYSLPVRAIPGIAIDNASSYADSTPFVGLAITSLALFAVYASWRSPLVRWVVVLAMAALVFSIGNATPVHGLMFSYLPMLGKARVPVRAIHLLNFAIVVLAAHGFDALRRSRNGQILPRVLFASGIALLLTELSRGGASDGIALAALAALILASLTMGMRRGLIRYRTFAAAVLCLVLFELYPVSTRTFTSSAAQDGQRFVRTLTDNRDIVEFLRGEPAPRRVAVNDSDIPTNFGDWHGFDGLEGYVAGATVNLLEIPRHTREIQNLYGVTHYIGRQPLRPEFQEVFAGESGVKVWRNPEAMPRVWSVHDTAVVPNRGAVDAYLSRPDFDPRRTAIFVGAAPELESCEGDELRLLARAPNRIRIQARLNCRGLLVLSETWYPGWVARVDGHETSVLETFGAIRGVVVEKGDHLVDLSYRPASVYAGATLTGCGLVIATGLLVWERRRQRNTQSVSRPVPTKVLSAP